MIRKDCDGIDCTLNAAYSASAVAPKPLASYLCSSHFRELLSADPRAAVHWFGLTEAAELERRGTD